MTNLKDYPPFIAADANGNLLLKYNAAQGGKIKSAIFFINNHGYEINLEADGSFSYNITQYNGGEYSVALVTEDGKLAEFFGVVPFGSVAPDANNAVTVAASTEANPKTYILREFEQSPDNPIKISVGAYVTLIISQNVAAYDIILNTNAGLVAGTISDNTNLFCSGGNSTVKIKSLNSTDADSSIHIGKGTIAEFGYIDMKEGENTAYIAGGAVFNAESVTGIDSLNIATEGKVVVNGAWFVADDAAVIKVGSYASFEAGSITGGSVDLTLNRNAYAVIGDANINKMTVQEGAVLKLGTVTATAEDNVFSMSGSTAVIEGIAFGEGNDTLSLASGANLILTGAVTDLERISANLSASIFVTDASYLDSGLISGSRQIEVINYYSIDSDSGVNTISPKDNDDLFLIEKGETLHFDGVSDGITYFSIADKTWMTAFDESSFNAADVSLVRVGYNDTYEVQSVKNVEGTEIVVNIPDTITGKENSHIGYIRLEATVPNGGLPTFSADNLPAGLTLSEDGVISGTPTVYGELTAQITVSADGYASKVIELNFNIAQDKWNIPLTFTAVAAGSVRLKANGSKTCNTIQYRLGTSGEWLAYSLDTKITLNEGESVQFQNTSEYLNAGNVDYVYFSMSGKIAASGNMQSMVNYSEVVHLYRFYSIFRNCTSLVQAPDLLAKDVRGAGYRYMFGGCTGLTSIELSAVTLADSALNDMFSGCSSLKHIKVNFTEWNDGTYPYTSAWVNGVASSGIFEKNEELAEEYGISYIPKGWAVVNASDGNKIYVGSPVDITGMQNNNLTDFQLSISTPDGGTPSLLSTGFPKGVTCSASGVISGTPTEAGTFTAYVIVRYEGYDSEVIIVNFTIEAQPVITPITPVEVYGVQNTAITAVQLSASVSDGGTPTFSVPKIFDGNLLPDGLSMSASGLITGTPTAYGNSKVLVNVDYNGAFTQSIEVNFYIAEDTGGEPEIPEITVVSPVSIPGAQDIAITPVQLEASVSNGGTPTFTGYNFPLGIRCSDSGLVSGSTSEYGEMAREVWVEYPGAEKKIINVNFSITQKITATIIVTTLPGTLSGTQFVPIYNIQIEAIVSDGGTPRFSAEGLPAGLKCSSSGLISGTPIEYGYFYGKITISADGAEDYLLNIGFDIAKGSSPDPDNPDNPEPDPDPDTGLGKTIAEKLALTSRLVKQLKNFRDVSVTTATAADVREGKHFFNAAGELTQGTNTADEDLEALEYFAEDLQKKFSALTQDYNALETNYSELQYDYSLLQENYSSLQSNYSTLQGDYSALQDNYAALENRNQGVQEELNAVQEELNTTTANHAAEINNINSLLDTINGEVI